FPSRLNMPTETCAICASSIAGSRTSTTDKGAECPKSAMRMLLSAGIGSRRHRQNAEVSRILTQSGKVRVSADLHDGVTTARGSFERLKSRRPVSRQFVDQRRLEAHEHIRRGSLDRARDFGQSLAALASFGQKVRKVRADQTVGGVDTGFLTR